jgi:hypothetical protein
LEDQVEKLKATSINDSNLYQIQNQEMTTDQNSAQYITASNSLQLCSKTTSSSILTEITTHNIKGEVTSLNELITDDERDQNLSY